MSSNEVSRRLFLQGSGSFVGSAALRAGIPGLAALAQSACGARDSAAAFDVLAASEAQELAAIASRIFPTTDTPGAHEAGVIWFIDKAMGDFMAPQLGFLHGGLSGFQDGIAGGEAFSSLDEDQQDEYLGSQEQTPFFGFVRLLTLMGMFGMSSYGGNRDQAGWKLLGLDPGQHAYQPPFGYYDAEHRKGESNGD